MSGDELTAPADEPENSAELDAIAGDVLGRLVAAGFFPGQPGAAVDFPAGGFADLDRRVRESFVVPHTTMTALTRRVMYGIAVTRKPSVVVVLGTFVGYASVWLFGPALPPAPAFPAHAMAGCDIFAPAVDQARANYDALAAGHSVALTVADAYSFLESFDTPIDLLYLDVDSPERGKRDYLGLLRQAEGRFADDALILAHDVTHPYYVDDIAPYREAVRDKAKFRRTATLTLDPCGLEVTLV